MQNTNESISKATCPLCDHNRTRFFAKHNAVDQELYNCNDCGLYFVYPHVPYISKEQKDFRYPSKEAEDAYIRWRDVENGAIANIIRSGEERISRLLEIGFGEGSIIKHLAS
ncbi:MAG TPA: hypothetical protein ENH82_13790, partial [bacterium]|nr:hypothetical protein [bacterium]